MTLLGLSLTKGDFPTQFLLLQVAGRTALRFSWHLLGNRLGVGQ